MGIKIVKCLSVPPAAANHRSLPLLYLDMPWLKYPLTENVLFYTLKCSESYFLDTIVEQLKHSLSITLKHFLPIAAKIVFPLTTSAMPVFRYTPGDSLSLTIAISDADFSGMTGSHPRAADEFHHLIPQMPEASYSKQDIKFSSTAVQVTLFPNQGICIGFTMQHAICDASSFFSFFRTWASINKLNSDAHLVGNSLPYHDRSRVEDQAKLNTLFWEQMKMIRPVVALSNCWPTHRVRASFVLNEFQIQRLKNLALNKKPCMGKVSSFVVVCAHIWSCLVKAGEEAVENEPEYFSSPVNCRARLEPPLPENFFGNCLSFMRAHTTHGRLRGEEGFVEAADVIATAIADDAKLWRGMSDYYENRRGKILSELTGKRVFRIAGSSRLDQYGADYGWGKAIKFEIIHTDHDTSSASLCRGRDGGIEIGMSLSKANMDPFAAIFHKELYINSNM